MLRFAILSAIFLSQYPQPTEECMTPATKMVFRWAVECPSHTLRFEFKDDGTFRVVCLAPKNAAKLQPAKVQP